MIYIIGTGRIAIEYVKLLKHEKKEFKVIGNSIDSVNKFEMNTGVKALSGGVKKHLFSLNKDAYFINCVGVDKLDEVTKCILKSNPKRILVEKPGFASINSALKERDFYSKIDNIFIACNRRFFDSVIKLKKILNKETAISAHFEFNERGIQIDSKFWTKEILSNWVFANSIHVIDTVFYLIGQPDKLSITKSHKQLEWIKNDLFIGHGKTVNDVLFTFNSNWISPGAWKIEVKCAETTYTLSPMEILKSYNRDGKSEVVAETKSNFKPGFKNQLNCFLNKPGELLNINQFLININNQKNIYDER